MRAQRLRSWSVCGIVLAGALIGSRQVQGGGELAEVKARGKLIVAVFPLQDRPTLSIDLDVMRQQGLTLDQLHKAEDFKGVDVDLVKGFAASLGVELELHVVNTGVKDLLQVVVDRKADLAASGIGVNPERARLVDFSEPYYTSGTAVAVRRDSKIAAPADLNGKTGAAMAGSVQIETLRQLAPKAKIKPTHFQLESLNMAAEGRVDFAVLGSPGKPGDPVEMFPGLKVAFGLGETPAAIAVRKGSDLAGPLNGYLAALRQSGELTRIFERNGLIRPPAKSPTPP
jgi:ABC-type amino acid transport substrate-binding protein